MPFSPWPPMRGAKSRSRTKLPRRKPFADRMEPHFSLQPSIRRQQPQVPAISEPPRPFVVDAPRSLPDLIRSRMTSEKENVRNSSLHESESYQPQLLRLQSLQSLS